MALRRFRPAGRRSGVLLCTHAMWANGGSQARFAAAAAEAAGLEVWVLDFRGHGFSVPPSARKGPDWYFDDYVERDLPAAVETVSRLSGTAPTDLIYMGHSLGGLVGLAGFGTGRAPMPKRLILVSVSCWRHGAHGPVARRAGIGLFDLSARLFGRAPIRALGLGSDDEPASYVRQLAGWARAGRWTSTMGEDYLAGLQRITAPTLAVVSTEDPLCTEADVQDLLGHLPVAPRMIRIPGNHFALFRSSAAAVWSEVLS